MDVAGKTRYQGVWCLGAFVPSHVDGDQVHFSQSAVIRPGMLCSTLNSSESCKLHRLDPAKCMHYSLPGSKTFLFKSAGHIFYGQAAQASHFETQAADCDKQ